MDLKITMRKIDKELSVLEAHEVKTNWMEHALWRRENHRWLRYSGVIAMAVIKRLNELKISQKELAEKMKCSPQYISKLLKGSENLTLDTISKLEDCLNLDLVKSSLSISSAYSIPEQELHMVAAPVLPEYGSKK